MAIAPQHWLSMARLVVGLLVWILISPTKQSAFVLPLVLLACLLDFSDGRVARARGSDGPEGRALDNVCDFVFLALFFQACAGIELWSDPVAGVLARCWRGANFIPLLALILSFGSYAGRAAVCAVFGLLVAPSPAGRAAGVLNYVLAVVGAAAVSTGFRQRPLVEAAMILVAAVNIAAFAQNCLVLERQLSRRRA